MEELIQIIMTETGATNELLAWSFLVVGALIVVFGLISLLISIWLAIRYVKFNRKKNSIGVTGEQAARKILDINGLQHIKVSAVGSLMFGNSYSHFFKKVRLRRRTYKKDSISSLAMAAQKSALAVLDKEKDPDMKRRNRLIPLVTFGPFLFIPLIIAGVVLDIVIKHSTSGLYTMMFAGLGLAFYALSFVLSIVVLRVEKKGQERAYEILRQNRLATENELKDIRTLFKLYNIQYVNNMILSFLEIIYRVLQIVAATQGGSSSSVSK